MKLSRAVEDIVESDKFTNLILICICINTVVLAAEFY
jgi:voltage-dependent calcium channel L type alpha-1S